MPIQEPQIQEPQLKGLQIAGPQIKGMAESAEIMVYTSNSTTRTSYRRRLRDSRSHLGFERLEARYLLAVAPMSPVELHMHELINLARADPDQAVARYSTPLNQGLPGGTISSASKPPLARDDQLRDAIQGHLEDMQQNNIFTHTGSNGSTYIQRAEAAGYTPWLNIGENIVWSGSTGPLTDLLAVAEELVQGWFHSSDHRKNLLDPAFKEVGSSFITGPYAPDGTTFNAGIGGQLFGTQSGDSFLTGVGCTVRHTTLAICDVNRPVSQATVTAVRQGDGISRSTITGPSGDYDLQLPAGTWNVTVTAAGFKNLTLPNIAVAGDNVKLDFTPEVLTPWQNPNNPMDVTADTVVAPNDALRIINSLNKDGPRSLPTVPVAPDVPPPFYDTSGDNFIAPGDASLVINFLNSQASAEGESGPGKEASFESRVENGLLVSQTNGSASQLQILARGSVFNAGVFASAKSHGKIAELNEFAVDPIEPLVAPERVAATDRGGDLNTLQRVDSEPSNHAHALLLDEVFADWIEQLLLISS